MRCKRKASSGDQNLYVEYTWAKHNSYLYTWVEHGKREVSRMPTVMSCVDLISRIIFVSEGANIHPSSCSRRERHGETSAEILRFTTLSRDEGYQSLELSSDNKLETSLLQSSAFFYVRNRHRKRKYYIPSENRMIFMAMFSRGTQ